MKQLLFLLLLPALALAQKAAPPSVIAGQIRRDFVQDSTIAANKAAIPTSASAINAVSATTYAGDKAAQTTLDGAQSTSIASVSAQVGANTTAIAGKMDVVFSTSAGSTTAAQTGNAKLIIEIIGSALTIYMYASTASPTLQKILTYN